MADNAQGIRAGQAYIEINATDKGMVQTMERARQRFMAFGEGLQKIGNGMRNAGLAILAPLGASVARFMSVGDKFDKMSSRTGASVEWLSEMEFVASQAGTGIEVVEAGMRKLSKSIGDAGNGTKSYLDALEAIGLNYEGLSALSPEKQFDAVAAALENVQDQSVRTQAAMTLMGRSATAMFPMFQGSKTRNDKPQGSQTKQRPSPPQGSQALAAKRAEARSLGLTISKTDTDNAAKLTDAWDVFKRQLDMTVVKIGAALAPALIKLAKSTAPILARVVKFTRENPGLVVQIGKIGVALLGAGVALGILGKAITGASSAFGLLKFAVPLLKGIAAAISLPKLAIAAFAAAVYTGTSEILENVFGMKTGISEIAGEIFSPVSNECSKSMDAIFQAFKAGGWGDAISHAWDTVKLGAMSVWTWLQEGWEGIRYTVVSLAYEAGYGAMEAWERISEGIRGVVASLCDGLAGFFASAWRIVKDGAVGAMNVVSRIIRGVRDLGENSWNLIKALTPGSGYTMKDYRRDQRIMVNTELKTRVAEDTRRGVSVSQDRRDETERARRAKAENAARRKQSEEYLKALDEERRKSLDRLQVQTAERMSKIRDGMDKSVEEHRRKREQVEANTREANKPDAGTIRRQANILNSVGKEDKFKRQYIFSSDATAAFLASSFALSSQTVSIKDIAKNVKKIRDNTDRAQDDDLEYGQ